MADLSELTAAQAIKITGADSAGAETAFVPVLNTAPALSEQGLIVRTIPREAATFVTYAADVATANNKSMIALYNTGASILKIHEIYMFNDQTTSVTGVLANFVTYRLSALSAGTAVTPQSYDTANAALSGITIVTGGTATETGSLMDRKRFSTDERGTGATDIESNDFSAQIQAPIFSTEQGRQKITLRQNQGLHIRCATNTTTGLFSFKIIFTVE